VQKRDKTVLWPVYFDSTRTRAEGRRVPKRLAKPSPTLDAVGKAVGNLGYSFEVTSDASHPRFHWKNTGYIFVKKTKPKSQLVMEVAKELSRLSV